MMNVRLLACTILAAGSLAGCASTSETDETVAAVDDSQKIVCRNTNEMGSRLKGRVCKTKAEWGIQSKSDRNAVRNQGRAAQGGAAGERGRVN